MTCPKCMGQMRQFERSGITVDQCTECRGIFLDRGELERLLDAENSWHGGGGHPQQQHQQGYRQQPRHKDWDSDEYPVYQQQQQYGHGQGQYPHKKKKRGFLEELFD
jgi:uncharacterized protein